jgi:hypothetical protein
VKEKTNNENRELVPNPEGKTKDNVSVIDKESNCNFDKLLSDPKTPKLAKEIFNNDSQYSEEPLTYFEYLKSSDIKTREFYFRVLTNSYKNADGAYAEGIGNLGKEFVENNPQEFATFFENKTCFDDNDLKIWAKIALLEFEIIDEYIETGQGEPLVNVYCKKLTKNSEKYSITQKETIKKFCDLLKNEWSEFLKHTES